MDKYFHVALRARSTDPEFPTDIYQRAYKASLISRDAAVDDLCALAGRRFDELEWVVMADSQARLEELIDRLKA